MACAQLRAKTIRGAVRRLDIALAALHIERVATRLGSSAVILRIPTQLLTADAGAIVPKGEQCVILRGGSDSFHSAQRIHCGPAGGPARGGLPKRDSSSSRPADRCAVGEDCYQLTDNHVSFARGGKGLVVVCKPMRGVPVFAHLEALHQSM